MAEVVESQKPYSWETLSQKFKSQDAKAVEYTEPTANVKTQSSVVHNPNSTALTGTAAARYAADKSTPGSLDTVGRNAVHDLQSFASMQDDYNMTPEEAFTRYNTTGVNTANRRKLSRLVDALNSRAWGTTAAALGATGDGQLRNNSTDLWKTLQMPHLETMESRAQRRVEGYENAAATAAIGRSDFLKRLAPQLESIRTNLKTQFASNLDNTQVRAIDGAINLFYNEKLGEFNHNELVRHLLNVASIASSLPDDVQKILFNSLLSLPQMSNQMVDLIRQGNETYQHAKQNNGYVSPEMQQQQDLLLQLYQTPLGQAMQAAGYNLGMYKDNYMSGYNVKRQEGDR